MNTIIQKKIQIKKILSTPGITNLQYQRALILLKNIENQEQLIINSQPNTYQPNQFNNNQNQPNQFNNNPNNPNQFNNNPNQLNQPNQPNQFNNNPNQPNQPNQFNNNTNQQNQFNNKPNQPNQFNNNPNQPNQPNQGNQFNNNPNQPNQPNQFNNNPNQLNQFNNNPNQLNQFNNNPNNPNQFNNNPNQPNQPNQGNQFNKYNNENISNNINNGNNFINNNENNIIKHHTNELYNSSPDLYKKNFISEEEKIRLQFESEEKIRRNKFNMEQERRRREYQQKLKDFEKDDINALDIMGLSPNFNMSELKTSYKSLAIQYHPDRPNGDKNKFQMVTKCYMSLLENLKNRSSNKDFNDLKSTYNNYVDKTTDYSTNMRDQMNSMFMNRSINKGLSIEDDKNKTYIDPNAKSFNSNLFNKLYEKNKLWDPNDEGYDDWFRNGPDTQDDKPELFGDKFNLNIFNTTFNNYKSKTNKSNSLVKYNEPRELISTLSKYTELDNTIPIDDFTDTSAGGLHYTDLKKAYTNGCDLINPNDVETRKKYNSIEDLKQERSKISHDMTPEEKIIYQQLQNEKNEAENNRINRLRQLEHIQKEHYKETHKNMIGYDINVDKTILRLN